MNLIHVYLHLSYFTFRNKFPNLIKTGAAKSLFKSQENTKEGEEEGEEDEGLVMKKTGKNLLNMEEEEVVDGISSQQDSPEKEV